MFVRHVGSSAQILRKNFSLSLKEGKYQEQRTKICHFSQRLRKETCRHWCTDQQEITIGICCKLRITYSCWTTLALSVVSFPNPLTFIPRHHIPEDRNLQFSSSRRCNSFDNIFVINKKKLQERENMVRGHGVVISHNDNIEHHAVY